MRTIPFQAVATLLVVACGSIAQAQTNMVQHGIATDYFVSADFDGDGKSDVAVYRPGAVGVSAFHIRRSSDQGLETRFIGQSGDDPSIVGDYDGDGKADPAVFRSGIGAGASNSWIYLSSAAGYSTVTVLWGQSGDFPVPGDYDGDHKKDFVVQRSSGGNGAFLMKLSGGGFETNIVGSASAVLAPGDYDGDGKTDICAVSSSGGNYVWTIKLRTGATLSYQFGSSNTDFITQGDYNGDGKTDSAVWRPGLFLVHFSTGSNPPANPASIDLQKSWGQSGDYPVANFNVH